jgi:ADP-ribose pyrophosphatase YjhB (NUDIX family)
LGVAVVEGRDRMRCTVCAFVLYENPACAAAGMVVDDAGRILLVRRAIEPWRGHWALPAGYQEVDEEPARTAAREVVEESGIEVEVVELVDLLYVPAPVKAANLAVYRCRPIGGSLRRGADTLEAAWFDPAALPSDMGFDNGPRILRWLAVQRSPPGIPRE